MTALALALAAGGCGAGGSSKTTTNEVTSQTAQEAYEASRAAVSAADSVSIQGTSSIGRLVKSSVDLKLTRNGGQGTLTLLGTKLEIVRSGGDVYVKGTPALYRSLNIKKTVPADTWVKVSGVASLESLTNLAEETKRVISASDGVTKGSVTTVDGEPALELKTEGKLYKGRLFLKTTGEPYPIKLEKSGKEQAAFTFSGWNATQPPAVPMKTVDAAG